MIRILFVAAMITAFGCTNNSFSYKPGKSFSELKRIVFYQEQKQHAVKYIKNIHKLYERSWPSISKYCSIYSVAAGINAFEIITVVGSSGNVIDVITNPENEALSCFKKSAKTLIYPDHNLSAMYLYFHITDKPHGNNL